MTEATTSFDPSGFITALILLILLIILVKKGIKIVRPYEKGVVERLGKFSRMLNPGIHILIPYVDALINVDIREIVLDVAPQEVITKDNVGVTVDAVIYYLVVDPAKVLYKVGDFREAASKLAQTSLRNVIGELSLDACLTSREVINGKLKVILDNATDPWGVGVGRVELKRIDPPQDINEAMSRQMKAERDRRAVILESEGDRDSRINVAEGQKRSAILKAEGEAQAKIKIAEAKRKEEILVAEGKSKAIENVFKSIHIGNPTNDLLSYQYLQTLEKMADGKATKIVVPYEVSSLMGLAASFKEILTENTNSGAKKDEVKPTPVKKGQEYKMNINDLNPAKTRKTEK